MKWSPKLSLSFRPLKCGAFGFLLASDTTNAQKSADWRMLQWGRHEAEGFLGGSRVFGACHGSRLGELVVLT